MGKEENRNGGYWNNHTMAGPPLNCTQPMQGRWPIIKGFTIWKTYGKHSFVSHTKKCSRIQTDLLH